MTLGLTLKMILFFSVGITNNIRGDIMISKYATSILISFCIILSAICSYLYHNYNSPSYISSIIEAYNTNQKSIDRYYKSVYVGSVDYEDSYFVKKVEESATIKN